MSFLVPLGVYVPDPRRNSTWNALIPGAGSGPLHRQRYTISDLLTFLLSLCDNS